MINFITRYKLAIIGLIIGAIAGYIYWMNVNCAGNSCPIASSPTLSTIFGAAIGALGFDSFRKGNNKKKDTK